MSSTRLIPGFVGGLIARALNIYIPNIVSFIPSPALQQFGTKMLEGLRDLVRAVSDNDPANRLQAETIFKVFFRRDAIPLLTSVVRERIETITNPRLQRGLSLLSVPVLAGAELLTDDDLDNDAQAEDVLDTFILNPEAQEFILNDLTVPVLENVVKDQLILSFILEALEKGLQEGAQELANIDVFVKPISEAKERALSAAK
jgi:hypothetical protein